MLLKSKYFPYIIFLIIPVLLTTFSCIGYSIKIYPATIDWASLKLMFLYYAFIKIIVLWPIPYFYYLFFQKNSIKNKKLGLAYTIVITNLLIYYVYSKDLLWEIPIDQFCMYPSYNLTALIIYFLYEFKTDKRKLKP